ncbi:MAG: hypothetical protein KUG73_09305 [Pseudomonadales bacterium]|nr:hypothetical protein [Pseudomonadales bacterium]
MLTETEYLVAWLVYILATFGVVGTVWRALSLLNFVVVRKVAIGVLLALLLTPWTVSVGEPRLAPALFVGVFDATLQRGAEDVAMYRALFPLSVSLMVVVLLLTAEHLLNKKHR